MASKKSGENIPEAFRNTERITLRLKPDVMALLYSLSTEVGEAGKPETLAKTVEQALRALDREMAAESALNESEGK